MIFAGPPRTRPKRRTGQLYNLDDHSGQQKPVKVFTGPRKALRIP